MGDDTFVEQTDRSARASRRGRLLVARVIGRGFAAADLMAAVVAVGVMAAGVSLGGENNGWPAVKPGVAVSDQVDARLWMSATTTSYYHNRVLVLPLDMGQNDPLVKKYLPSGDRNTVEWRAQLKDRRARLAWEIRNKDVANEILRALTAVEQDIQRDLLPAAYEWARSDPFLLRLRPGEADERIISVKRPFLPSIDELRKTKVSVSYWATTHHNLNTLIAEDAERHYRKALGDKKLPEDARFHIREHGHGTAKIAYAGTKPLTNVVVVASATMRPAGPKAEATRRWVDFVNESFEPGADANKDAAQLLKATHVLHETPQAAFIYIPVLEPGDDLVVEMYEQGFYWDALEAKVSIYSDAGMMVDKVLFVGGRHNDLSVPGAERVRLNKLLPREKSLGPVFTPLWRTEIVLKKDVTGPFERCVPMDANAVPTGPANTTYLKVGLKDQIDVTKPLEVIARGADAYVAVGPKKRTGRALLLIPRTGVAKLNDFSKKKYEERKVQPLMKRTWLLLKPPADGSTDYQLATALSLVENVCTLSGSTAGLAVRPDEPFRALAVGENEYVVFLPKPASDGNTNLVLVPKSLVKEVKDKR